MYLKQSGNILKLSNKIAGKNVFLVIWAITQVSLYQYYTPTLQYWPNMCNND